MPRAGIAYLPLHGGSAPRWLVKRMQGLARNITLAMVDELGRDAFLRRISDPCWFQALGCVLGFDWHSSGVTTVVTGVLKSAIDPAEAGLAVCGGKGKRSINTPAEIRSSGEALGLSTSKIDDLVYASKIGAKVDNAAIQAGYPLYHHAFILSEDGKWAIVQQGLNAGRHLARRYHWLSEDLREFTVEPHKAVAGIKEVGVLNMTARESEGCRKISVDLVKGDIFKLKRDIAHVGAKGQRTLNEWTGARVLVMPWEINWKAVEAAYNAQPRNYEELIALKGIGPSTLRGLALVSELIYGEPPSWQDPVRYSFAYGGKDGVPFPVRRKEMDESIDYLRLAVENARLGDRERLDALGRLAKFESAACDPSKA